MRTETWWEDADMRVTTLAVLGSLVINSALGLAVAAVFSVQPARAATEPLHCSSSGHAVHATHAPTRPSLVQGRYLVATRMGWAAG
jgi:hypothetical protein